MARNRITNSQYLEALAIVEQQFPGTVDTLKACHRALIENDTQDENADLLEESLRVIWKCIDDIEFIQNEANSRKHRELCFMLVDQFTTRASAAVLLELARPQVPSDGLREMQTDDPVIQVTMTGDATDSIRRRGDYRVNVSPEVAERLGLAPNQTVVQIVELPVNRDGRWLIGISVGSDDEYNWSISEKGNGDE